MQRENYTFILGSFFKLIFGFVTLKFNKLMSIYFYEKDIFSFCKLVAAASIFACLDTQHFLESWLRAETSPLVAQALGC